MSRDVATKRTYGEGCGIAHALDLVGERWALLVIRELLLGPKRFTDLRAGIPHVSPNVLSERLRELDRVGVVARRKLGPPASARVYELTEWGRELEPAVLALGRWGARSPYLPTEAGMSTDSQVLALRTVFDSAAARGPNASFELRLDGDRFRATVRDGRFEIARGEADDPDAVIEADQPSLAAVLWGGRRLVDAQRSGGVRVEGDAKAAERFLGLFNPARRTADPGRRAA
jgi:DNA-binding HxlR family transcriptional regulator/putative sterol carrier protein